jgi:hypothetical protein
MSNTPRQYSNLGYKVTTRIVDWGQMVREVEGSRWNLPTGKYFFGDGDQRVFVTYSDAVTGPGGN